MLKPKKRLVKATLKEDRFVILTAQAEAWFEQHKMRVIYASAGVLAIAVIAAALSWSRTNAIKQASLAELLARDAYARADFDSTLLKANAILEDFNGTPSAGVALMLKGRVYEQRAQFEEAEKAFEEVIDDYADSEYLAFGAYHSLGTIAHGKSDWLRAAEYFEKAGSKYPGHFNAPVALVKAGEAFEKAGKISQAKSAYRKVLGDYPKSRSADAARDNLARLEFLP